MINKQNANFISVFASTFSRRWRYNLCNWNFEIF